MTDLSQFAAEGFDPKAWINAACSSVPDGETLERCIVLTTRVICFGHSGVRGVQATGCIARFVYKRRVPHRLQPLRLGNHSPQQAQTAAPGGLPWMRIEAPRVAHRHLAGLEMRLALAGEDVEAGLAEAGDRALRRIPAAQMAKSLQMR